MTETDAIERLVAKIQDYARGRTSDVARGAETPRLAALLVQKYGCGLVDATGVILDSDKSGSRLQAIVDEETTRIDADWRENARRRWAARPADITVGSPE
ncbi:hypothetical protein [Bradyrhizobium sp. USDA 4520]